MRNGVICLGEYGKWNSVFMRYRRWGTTGMFDAMVETLAELAGWDMAADMIDSAAVRAHHVQSA